jgi:hypothetical protein
MIFFHLFNQVSLTSSWDHLIDGIVEHKASRPFAPPFG